MTYLWIRLDGFDDYCMVLMTLAGFKLKTNNSELKLTY